MYRKKLVMSGILLMLARYVVASIPNMLAHGSDGSSVQIPIADIRTITFNIPYSK